MLQQSFQHRNVVLHFSHIILQLTYFSIIGLMDVRHLGGYVPFSMPNGVYFICLKVKVGIISLIGIIRHTNDKTFIQAVFDTFYIGFTIAVGDNIHLLFGHVVRVLPNTCIPCPAWECVIFNKKVGESGLKWEIFPNFTSQIHLLFSGVVYVCNKLL